MMSINNLELGVIAVVDDDSLVTKPVERLLRNFCKKENLPYRIISSQWPEQILNQVANENFDLALVLTDIKMMPMDGIEFLRIVKDRYPDTVLMTLTGYANEVDLDALKKEFKLFSYLEKPWNDEQLRRNIKNALDAYRRNKLLYRYVPKEVVEEMLRHPNSAIMAGIETEATILFLNFKNSNLLFQSSQMDIQNALLHLNTYLRELLEILGKFENGILDKFTGDGLMALFGITNSKTSRKDAQSAVLAALEMQQKVYELNQQSKQIPLSCGIGISTGTIIAGNVGTEERANYTALGSTVNTASSLEGAANAVPSTILISSDTYEYVKELVVVRKFIPSSPIKHTSYHHAFEVIGRR